jgi:hypothetical protein
MAVSRPNGECDPQMRAGPVVDRKLSAIDTKRRVYRLSPAGPEGLLGAMSRLAGNAGTLVGSLHDDRVQIWLEKATASSC